MALHFPKFISLSQGKWEESKLVKLNTDFYKYSTSKSADIDITIKKQNGY